MDITNTCHIDDIKALEDSKFYTPFADPILKSLITAVQNKILQPISALVWITLKMEVHLRTEDWAIKKSIRSIKSQFGISQGSAEKALRQLEEGGFIAIERGNRQCLRTEANTIKVRFPISGIELAKLDTDRTKKNVSPSQSQAGQGTVTKDLSTEVSQNIGHACPKIWDSIKNTSNKKIVINKPTALSTTEPLVTEAVEPETLEKTVDCCQASPKEDQNTKKQDFGDAYEPDPLIEKITAMTQHIENLKDTDKELTAIRQAEPRNLDAFKQWQQCRAAFDVAEINLESLKSAQVSVKTPAKIVNNLPSNTMGEDAGSSAVTKETKPGSRRNTTITLPESLNKRIEQRLATLKAKKCISDPKGLAEQVKYQVSHFAMGESPEHDVNICLKLIQTNKFRTPGGYHDPELLQRDAHVRMQKAQRKAAKISSGVPEHMELVVQGRALEGGHAGVGM